MSNVKISALPAATTPLTGTELVPLVQSGVTSQVAVSNIKTTPAGSNTQVQFNNSSAFGASASLTWDGTSLTATKLAGAHNGTVGATTPSTGAFTTLSASGATNLATGGVTVSTQLGTLTAPTTNALQHLFNGAAVWMGQTTAGGETDLGWNFYYNTGFKSRVSDVASRLSFNPQSGYVSFFHAPSPGSADAALTFTESMRIQSPTTTTGVIALGTLVTATTVGVGGVTPSGSGSGVQFPATQSASTDANTLDDYEEGTWTPVFSGSGGATGQSYSRQVGIYTKIGNMVTATFAVINTTIGTLSGPYATLSGLPFTVKNDVGGRAAFRPSFFSGLGTSYVFVSSETAENTTYMYMNAMTAAATTLNTVGPSSIWASGSQMNGTITYFTA